MERCASIYLNVVDTFFGSGASSSNIHDHEEFVGEKLKRVHRTHTAPAHTGTHRWANFFPRRKVIVARSRNFPFHNVHFAFHALGRASPCRKVDVHRWNLWNLWAAESCLFRMELKAVCTKCTCTCCTSIQFRADCAAYTVQYTCTRVQCAPSASRAIFVSLIKCIIIWVENNNKIIWIQRLASKRSLETWTSHSLNTVAFA